MLLTRRVGIDSESFEAWLETKIITLFLFQPSRIARLTDTYSFVNKQYAICRFQKRSLAELPFVERHNERKVHPMNADLARRDWNVDYLMDKRPILERWQARMSECGNPKVRKNAVPAIEAIFAFSPEAARRIDPHEWGKDCGEFVARHFGSENLISLVLHLDEKTPHCSAVIVPLVQKASQDGPANYRLSASYWLDGPVKLQKMQSLFSAEVGRKYGLERGEEGSSRKHVPQSELYKNSNRLEATITEAVQSSPTAQSSSSPEAHQREVEAHLRERLAGMAEAARMGVLAQQASRAAAAAELRRKKGSVRR